MSFLFGSSAPKVNTDQSLAPVTSLTIQQSSYGTPVPICYGTNRLSANLLWYGDFKSQQIVTGGSQSGGGGGKGGGGGGVSTSQTISYIYYTSAAFGLCEGQVQGIGQVYRDKAVVAFSDAANGGSVTLFNGALGQSPWGYLSTYFPDNAIGYNKMAYVGMQAINLGNSANLPNFSFELSGKLIGYGQDAFADKVIQDFLAQAKFPVSSIDTSMTDFANYCRAVGFFISPFITDQRPAIDILNEWALSLNSEFVWSNGLLSIQPYGDTPVSANGASYTPVLTPAYNLNDADFIVSGDEDPITVTRSDLADAYNQVPIEFMDRANQYNISTYTAEDAGHIDMYGVRTATTIPAHHFTLLSMATNSAQMAMWRGLYVTAGAQYKFKLPWNYILLDPMDYVAINDATLGLNNTLVRITDITEDEDGLLNFTCESVPGAIAGPPLYSAQTANRYSTNYNVDPGAINTPIFFEAPLALVQASAVEIYIPISAPNTAWGGCNVWVSNDGNTYGYLCQINGMSRQGVLTSTLPTYTPPVLGGNNIDQMNTLSVDMTESNGLFNNQAVNTDAVNLNTLCYVDGELIAFGNDVLTAANKYNLTYLNRGCYGTTILSHAAGSQFARIDNSVFIYDVDQSRIGQKIYFKFCSFNIYGGGLEQLGDVPAYNYTVTGSALSTPLPNPTNLSVLYTGNIAQISWTGVQDIRYPIYYEIRNGSSFTNSQVVGRTTQTVFPVYGSGTYYVSALYFTPFGTAIYSSTPPSIAVATPSIIANSLGSYTEEPGWSGTKTNTGVVGSSLQLADSVNVLGIANILTTANVINGGSVVSSGSYQVASGHRITSTYVAPLKVILNWTISGVSVTSNILTEPDFLSLTDILGAAYQSKVSAQPQIRLSQDGGSTWGSWINWTPGYYIGNAVDFQILLVTTDTTINAVLSDFSYEVDIDSRTDSGTANTSASGNITVNYPVTYNSAPIPQITIQNGAAGDDVILSSIGASSFAIQVVNAGSKVVRSIGWSVTSY